MTALRFVTVSLERGFLRVLGERVLFPAWSFDTIFRDDFDGDGF